MKVILLFLVFLVCMAGISLFLYRFQGKKQLLKFDIVQFFYAFLIAPLLFVWIKTFLYIVLKNQLGSAISANELFAIDTVLSVVFLYCYAFLAMHALTKTFWINNTKDPLYDMFMHSEYIHLWLTHIVLIIGSMVLVSFLGLANLFFPLNFSNSIWGIVLITGIGVVSGIVTFMGVLMTDPKQETGYFLRLMKLAFGIFFSIYVILYIIFDPPFSTSLSIYWWSFFLFATTVCLSFFTYTSERAKSAVESSISVFKHVKWGTNISLFEPKKD